MISPETAPATHTPANGSMPTFLSSQLDRVQQKPDERNLRDSVCCEQMWQDKAGANADGGPVAATTIGESAGNALTPGAVSAVPALAPNGGGGDGAAGGNNGPPASEAPAAAPPSAGAQMKRWAFVTGGRSLSMLRPSGVVPK